MTPSSAAAAARRDGARGRHGSSGGHGRSGGHRRAPRARARARARLLALTAFVLLAVAFVAVLPSMQRAVRDFTLPLVWQDTIRAQAADKHIDPALIAAVIYAETKFEPRPSAAGAEGPMQILPATARYLARRSGGTTFTTADLNNPDINIAYGSYYLRYLLDTYGGNPTVALAAYNGGEANVDRWLAVARADHHTFTVDDIPYPETRAYVRKVLKAQKEYRARYPTQLGYR